MLYLYGTKAQEDPGRGCGRKGHGLGQPGFHRVGDRAASARFKPGALVPFLLGILCMLGAYTTAYYLMKGGK